MSRQNNRTLLLDVTEQTTFPAAYDPHDQTNRELSLQNLADDLEEPETIPTRTPTDADLAKSFRGQQKRTRRRQAKEDLRTKRPDQQIRLSTGVFEAVEEALHNAPTRAIDVSSFQKPKATPRPCAVDRIGQTEAGTGG